MFSATSQSNAFGAWGAKETEPQAARDLQKFLRFQLKHEVIGLLPANIVATIVQVAEADVLPAPQMHPCVMGVYNWRNEMVWMVDLQYLLGYSSTETETKSAGLGAKFDPYVMIVRQQERILGLVVPLVEDLVDLDIEQIHSPSGELFSGQLLPFIEGYFMSANREIMMLLKPDAVFALG